MKKVLSILFAIAFCFSVCFYSNAEQEKPAFEYKIEHVKNEPEKKLDEWQVEYNVWESMPNKEAIAAGDTVTLLLSYTVPEKLDGYDEKLAASLELSVKLNGLKDIKLVEANGCPQKLDCDYEAGFCMPVLGEYANVELSGDTLKVMAELSSNVEIVIRGIATEKSVSASTTLTVGQRSFPAVFSLGTLDKREDGGVTAYNIHWSDFARVQKRSMEIRKSGDTTDAFVGLNNHYYRVNGSEFVPVDDSFNDITEDIGDDELTSTLNEIRTSVTEFFGLSDDLSNIDDSSFFDKTKAVSQKLDFDFGASAGGSLSKLIPILIAAAVVLASGVAIAIIRKKKLS